MNMLRHIFSFRLFMVFALVALFMASVYITPAEARRRHIVTCPCPFASLYAASKYQAKKFGRTNKVEFCFEDSNEFRLEGGQAQEDSCFTTMVIEELETTPFCTYVYTCDITALGTNYGWFLPGGPAPGLPLTPEEVKACRSELASIARLNDLFPCEPPPT